MKKIQPPPGLAEESERLIRANQMPALEQVMGSIDETRVKYAERIRAARRNPPAAYLEFFRNLTPAEVERLKLEMPRARKQ